MISARTSALRVVRALRARGHQALWAGGCVRDMLLGRVPQDYDVATSARPAEVEDLFEHTVAVGKAFGVIRVRIPALHPQPSALGTHHSELSTQNSIEVATFRTEGPYLDGRRPSSIGFTTPEGDARRRDFTINGLFYDPIARKVLDFVDGQRDLQRKRLRAIGDATERFREDHLRLLRCIRFVAQLGFRIETETWKAIVALAPRIRRVSAERVREELNKLLVAPHAARALRLLSQSGLLQHLLPELEKMRGVPQPRAWHPEGDVFVHTLRVVGNLRKPGPQLAWAALLHDVGKPPTFEKALVRKRIRIRFPEHARVGAEMSEKILRRLRFSNMDREQITRMVANHMTFKDVKSMRPATLKRLLARPTFEDELALHRADCAASNGKLTNALFLRRRRRELSQAELRPAPLIGGRDLIALGLKPGPLFGRLLAAVEEEQLDGRLRTREEAIGFVQQHRREFER